MVDSHSDSAQVALADGCFDWRLWGDEAVVYVLATGATQELSPSAVAVLSVLLETPGAALSDLALLAALYGDDDAGVEADGRAAQGSPDLQQLERLRELLGHMQVMGLIERRAPVLQS